LRFGRRISAIKLELTLELDIRITDGSINISGIIKAVHQQGKAIITEFEGDFLRHPDSIPYIIRN